MNGNEGNAPEGAGAEGTQQSGAEPSAAESLFGGSAQETPTQEGQQQEQRKPEGEQPEGGQSQQPEGQQPEGQQPEGQQPEGAQKPDDDLKLTPEQYAKLQEQFSAQQQPGQQQPQQQQPKQLSQEEINKALNIYRLSEDDFNAVFETEDKGKAIEAFNGILQKVATQAVTMSRYMMLQEQQKLRSQIDPYIGFAEQQREQVLTQQFYTENKDLQGMEQVVDMVKGQLAQEGFRAKDQKHLFSEIAKRTKATLQMLGHKGQESPGGQPQAQAPQGQPVVQAPKKPAMAPLPQGGQSGTQGAANQGAKTGESATAMNIFG